MTTDWAEVFATIEPSPSCCADQRIPGVLWPIASNCDWDHDWIERCDECKTFPDDVAAAEAVDDQVGGVKYAVPFGSSGEHPYCDNPTQERDQ